MSSLHQGVKDLAGCQEDFRAAITTQVNCLAAQIQQVLTHLTEPSSPDTTAAPSPPAEYPSSVPAFHAPAPRLSPPEKFSGESGECRAFLVDCKMHYELQPSVFPTDRAKVAFMISHLTGRARAWATAEWSRGSLICESIRDFTEALRRAFDPLSSDREKARELSHIKQGTDPVCDMLSIFEPSPRTADGMP